MKSHSCSNYTVPKLKLECSDEITLDPQYLHCVKAFPSPKIDNSFFKGVIKPSVNIVPRKMETLEELKQKLKPKLIELASSTGEHWEDIFNKLKPLLRNNYLNREYAMTEFMKVAKQQMN